MEKNYPQLQANEIVTHREVLNFYRATVLRQFDGLNSAQLNTTLPPSTMTLGGMLKHLAYVEDWWFGEIYGGGEPHEPWAGVDWDADVDWDWHSAVHDSPERLRAFFEEAVARSNEVLDAASSWDDLSVLTSRRTGEKFSLRRIVLHLITEYARHAGHADLIRESIDGAVDL